MDWTFEKSRFKEKHIVNGLQAQNRPLTNDVFTNTFGPDQLTENLQNNAERLTAGNIFSNLNLAKRHLIPKKKLKSKIAQSYHQAFGNKSVRWGSEGKRADHSKNKLKLQDHLKEEYDLLAERRQEEKLQYMNYVTEADAAVLVEKYSSVEDKNALREWAMTESTDNILINDGNNEINQSRVINYTKDLVSEKVEERLAAYSKILMSVNDINLEQFDYSTDREFASNYAKKYELLCKGAVAGTFIKKFREDGGSTIDGVCLADLEWKIRMMNSYKRDYELRIQLLRSPLYALLSSDDIKDYLENREVREAHASEELKNYIQLFELLENSQIGKRKDITALYEEGKRQKREVLSTEYVQRVSGAIDNIEVYEGKRGGEILDSLAEKKGNQIRSGLDLSDHGFIENTTIDLEGEKLLGLNSEGLKALEMAISETIRNQANNDLVKNEGLLKNVEDQFKKLAEARRNYVVSIKTVEYLRELRAGLGCDLNNPVFKDKPEGKLLAAIRNDTTLTAESFVFEKGRLVVEYRNKLSALADTLHKNGYNVYDGLAEQALIEKTYDEKPQMEQNSVMALIDDALHANSKQALEQLSGRQHSTKAGAKRFFELFKEKYSETCGELPDENQAQAYTESEEKQIKWILHQLVGRDEFNLRGIDEAENLWDKKMVSEQNKGQPVSDRLRKNVSDIFSVWRESITILEREKEAMRTRVRLNANRKKVDRENKLKEAYDKKNINKPKITRDRKAWEEKIKGSYDRVLKLESAGQLRAFVFRKETNDEIRQRIINDAERKERRDFYMEFSDEEREELRQKKTYVLSQKDPEEIHKKNRYGTLYKNSIRDVEEVLRKLKPEAYDKVDTIQMEKDPEKRTVELYHAEGTRLLEEEGHDVIEIDVGGSSYREFSHAQNGFYGYSEGEDYELLKEYGEKYVSSTTGKKMDYIRVKSREGTSEKAKDRKKYRYTIAGPSPEEGGISNAGDYSIENTTNYILEIGKNHLKDLFFNWEMEDIAWEKNQNGENPAEKRQKIDFLFRGHSRGGVGSILGAMKLNYWIHKYYPQYEKYVDLHIIQYDAVPGKFDDWGGYDVVDHTAKGHTVKKFKKLKKIENILRADYVDEEYRPLGKVDTTMIYSMNTQYQDFFAAQEVRNAKRLIFTPFNHAVGLDAESTDATQLDQKGEKLHAMTFYDTTTGKAYRQSGLHHLGEGVYIMDEKHNLVKIDSLEEYIRIVQLTVPDNEIKEQYIRHMAMLHAVASKFNVDDKAAEALWKENQTKAEVEEAALKWGVYDSENKVQSLVIQPEADKDLEALKKAVKERKESHQTYIYKNTNKGPVRDFLDICNEVNYYIDYYNNGLFEISRNRDKSLKNASEKMTSYMKQFVEAEKSINMDELNEEQKLIVDTAADKVSEQLNAINSVVVI